jgi:signal transduction histidine kinase
MAVHVVWLVLWVGLWAVAIVAFVRAAPNVAKLLPLVGLLFLVVTFTTMRRILRRLARPIEALTEASRRFGAGELSYRVPDPWPQLAHHRRHGHRPPRRLDELTSLGTAWNEMADRIERLVGGQRELLANVSHELRSPLARLRVALELLPRDAATDARIAECVADIEELDRLIDDVLTASRLDGATR